MKGNAWFMFLGTATLEIAVIFLGGWLIWINLSPAERAAAAGLWISHAGMPILAVLLLLLLLGLGINLMFRWYITPLRGIAEEIRVMAMTNARHRLEPEGRPELQDLITSINLLAERHQAMQEDVKARIQEANAALEEEKNTLATLMSKLTQGVLVCNRGGRILLYNQRAQTLLEKSGGHGGGADWIGLGRSVYGVLDEDLVAHALLHIGYRLQQGETGLMVPFIASRTGGQLLSVHLVPILDKDNVLTGYILTLEDITRRTATESRRGTLLQSLTQGQRSGIAGIRAAIEAIMDYPDMDRANRHQFHMIIRDEALRLSGQLDQAEAEHAPDLEVQWPLEEMVGSDLLAAIERRSRDTAGTVIKMSAPREPLWLKVDSYTIAQSLCFIVSRLREGYHAGNLELSLEDQTPFACMIMSWEGAALDMETLGSWNEQAIITNKQGSSLTLSDVVERHGGTVWTHTDTESGRCSLHMLLPMAPDEPMAAEPLPEDIQENYYDFHLLKRSAQKSQLEELPLTELTYTVLDTETTGLYPSDGDEIIAIGAVRIVNGRVLKRESFDCLIKPRRPVSPTSVEIHGISPDMLRRMPPIEDVLPKFHRFVEDTVIIGHIVAFDMRFIELAEARTGIQFDNHVLDTLMLSHVVHPNQEEQSMEAIARRLGITVTGRHTAFGDALTTAEIFVALIPLLKERGIRTLKQAKAACESSELARVSY